jgi:O-antigen/teichoic acid export membrane protein
MTVVFGARWREAGYALMALGPSCGALSLAAVAAEIWKATGRVRFLPRMHGLALGLTAVLVAAAVPVGLVGVCGAISLASVGVALYAVWGMHVVTEIRARALASELWPPAAAAALMAMALYAIDRLIVHAGSHTTAVDLALLSGEALLGAAVYLTSLRLIAPARVAELAGLVRPLLGRLQLKASRAPLASEHGR